MWTSNRGHIFRVDGIQCHNIGVCSNVVMQKKRNVSRKPLIGQTVIAPYMKDANNHILFTMKDIDMKFGRDAYGERMHLPTRFEPDRGWTTIRLFFCPPPFQPSQYWVKIAVVV